LVVSWEEACLLFLEERKTSNRNWHDWATELAKLGASSI
jgi:hypothetical protein